jgi:type 1 glutamine amidotransferase
VIIQVDPNFYEGHIGPENGKWSNQSFVPFVYTHEFEGGRVWYSAMGHTDENFSDPNWIQIISWGVDYAFGKFATPPPTSR